MKPIVQISPSPYARKPLIEHGIREVVGDAIDKVGAIYLRFTEGDHRIALVLDLMRRAGVPPASRETERSTTGDYDVTRLHQFEDEDYLAAEYLWLESIVEDQDLMSAQFGRVDGQLVIDVDQTPTSLKSRLKKYKIWSTDSGPLLVNEQVRSEMIAEKFVGLDFRSTLRGRVVRGDLRQPAKLLPVPANEHVFEVFPVPQLPPMPADSVIRLSHYHTDGTREPQQGPGAIRSPGFDDFQPVYRRADLLATGPFDVARTWEFNYGPPVDPDGRWLIVSQRFYQYCLKYSKIAIFIPVQILED